MGLGARTVNTTIDNIHNNMTANPEAHNPLEEMKKFVKILDKGEKAKIIKALREAQAKRNSSQLI